MSMTIQEVLGFTVDGKCYYCDFAANHPSNDGRMIQRRYACGVTPRTAHATWNTRPLTSTTDS